MKEPTLFIGNEKFKTVGIDSLKQGLFIEGTFKESACLISDEQRQHSSCLWELIWSRPKYRVFSGPYFPVFEPKKLCIWTIFTQWVG